MSGIAFPTLSTKQLAILSFLVKVFMRADEHGKRARPFPEELEPGCMASSFMFPCAYLGMVTGFFSVFKEHL